MNAGRILLLSAVPEGSVFSLDQQTLVSIGIQLFNAGLLAVALTYLLYKPVRNFLRARTDRIKTQLQSAQDDRAKAEELKARYEQRFKEIERERDEILESAHKLAAVRGEQMLAKAQKEAEAMLSRAAGETRVERERASEEIRLHIIDVASLMAEKIVARTMDEETLDRLFTETMAELEGAVWQD